MGHYAGEMDLLSPDPYNYKAVRELGFESILCVERKDVKVCPRCFALVIGEYAEDHWWSQHQQMAYYAYSPNMGGFSMFISNMEETAAGYARLSPDDIVYGEVVDR